jgi:hypothetical protein
MVANMDPLQAAKHFDVLMLAPHPIPCRLRGTQSVERRWMRPRPIILALDTTACSHDHKRFDFLHASTFQQESFLVRTSLGLAKEDLRVPANEAHQPCRLGPSNRSPIAFYHPEVVIVRANRDSGHYMLDSHIWPNELPVIAMVTMHKPLPCAIFHRVHRPDGTTRAVFADDAYRNDVKSRMRISLRIAAKNGHVDLVLCGLGNPNPEGLNPVEEVAWCWLEVLREPEFNAEMNGGSWWRSVVLAVWDPKTPEENAEGAFETFKRVLDGKRV